MSFIDDIIAGKRWLFYGSLIGGSMGALLIHINELMPQEGGLTLGLKLGLISATALGMIGGIIGGVIGSLLSGFFAGEDIFVNVGVSLGIGLTNGFIAGTFIGFGLGCLHKWWPHLITPNTILMFVGLVALATIILFLINKRKSRSKRHLER